MDLRLVLIPDPNGLPPRFDLAVENGDLALDDGLETALLVSLFTDRRAHADDVLPDYGNDRRGWWGDSYADIEGDLIGSRLWLLERERDLADVPLRAKLYLAEAVQWLIDDGVVDQVDVQAERSQPGMLAYAVIVNRPNAPPRRYQFNHFWGA
jgi:phage gp46-like protein